MDLQALSDAIELLKGKTRLVLGRSAIEREAFTILFDAKCYLESQATNYLRELRGKEAQHV